MWLTFLLGPFLALLPRRWTSQLSFRAAIHWRVAGIVSGFGEALLALIAMVIWYSFSVSSWISRGLDAALARRQGPEITDQEIGFAAIVILVTHPLTWLIAYFGIEGLIRMVSAAFTESYLGLLPLFALDRLYLRLTGRAGPGAAKAGGFKEGNLSSYAGAIRAVIRHSRDAPIPDELLVTRDNDDEILVIRACRPKADWTPPRTVLFEDIFYRLEGTFDGVMPRPYHYRLRRLSAGVRSRTVLVYSPEEAPVLAKE